MPPLTYLGLGTEAQQQVLSHRQDLFHLLASVVSVCESRIRIVAQPLSLIWSSELPGLSWHSAIIDHNGVSNSSP